jgi:predicted  nucleic acid-binding Zn-ribbon protein
MSNIVREFIKAPVVVITDEEILQRREDKSLALAAYDAERDEHAVENSRLRQEVASLQEIISDLKQKIEAKLSGIVHEQLPFFEDSVEYKNELDEKGIFWRYGDLG